MSEAEEKAFEDSIHKSFLEIKEKEEKAKKKKT